MSYRTFKRMLGETSLERKCRFLFGSGLMLLITGSFYFYGRLTAELVYEQNKITGRLLIAEIIQSRHAQSFEENQDFRAVIEKLISDLKPTNYSSDLFTADPSSSAPGKRPSDPAGYEALNELIGGKREVVHMLRDKGEYQYYGAVRASASCLLCHNHERKANGESVQVGELIGMAKITFPLKPTERALAWNKSVLIATAIATAFLAMLAANTIVRYVIVKPVLHLKEVSDAIARGNLDLRADIRTGDEFEELSHAFNRMLRHLVAVQEELRQVNADLDGKVDELAQVNLTLFEMNNLKSEFLATMSHELRTPLNSILGFSDVLASAPNLDEKQQRYVRNILTSGKDLLTLINDILDLAKIESGKMELRIAELSLADLVERLVSMVRPLAEKKNIDLTFESDPEIPLLTQDAGKLQQILYNLLSNAIKFTPEGGRVRVRAALCPGALLELVVEDTGVGIPLEEQETIFEKFRQGNTKPGRKSSLTREYTGTGLGLSIVKELSKLLGGEVGLSSELGKGSTFTVRLPLFLQEQPQQLDADLNQQTLELNKLRRMDLGLVGIAGPRVLKS
jgi:signal transduction histidine kinase